MSGDATVTDAAAGSTEPKPGDTFIVTLEGISYETVIDDRNVQRFRADPEHYLLKAAPKKWFVGLPPDELEPDLNEMAMRYRKGAFPQRDYAEMNMALGYSVSGFSDLSSFHDMRLANSLWGDDMEDPLAGIGMGYLAANVEKGVLTRDQAVDLHAHVEGVEAAVSNAAYSEFMGEDEEEEDVEAAAPRY